MCGTAEFVSPEVVSYDYVSTNTDMWSIGTYIYNFLGFSFYRYYLVWYQELSPTFCCLVTHLSWGTMTRRPSQTLSSQLQLKTNQLICSALKLSFLESSTILMCQSLTIFPSMQRWVIPETRKVVQKIICITFNIYFALT